MNVTLFIAYNITFWTNNTAYENQTEAYKFFDTELSHGIKK